MKRFTFRRAFVLLVAFLILPLCVAAQSEGTSNSGGNTEAAKTPDSRAERKKAKKEWKKNRKQEMSDAKSKKQYNKKYNTKKTRKRMKKAEKKAKKNNEHKGDFFIIRWWHKVFK